MKKIFINKESILYNYRWFIVFALAVTGFMAYHDAGGGRMFTFNRQQQPFTASGPGSHK